FVCAHAGSLRSSDERQIRSHVMRTHPRRPTLPTRWNSDQAGGSITQIHGRWTMATWRHGRIYLGGRWHEPSAGPLKLPAGNNSAYLARDGRCRLILEL